MTESWDAIGMDLLGRFDGCSAMVLGRNCVTIQPIAAPSSYHTGLAS